MGKGTPHHTDGRRTPVEVAAAAVAGSPARPPRPAGLVGGRYALTGTLRYGAAGGVFTGRDTVTGAPVVVKQARAGDRAAAHVPGWDGPAALRREAHLLARFDGSGLMPRPLALVDRTDQVLLVEEHLPGQPLCSWVCDRLTRDGTPDVPWEEAAPMALALTELLTRCHESGLVLRDLSPSGVLVAPDGSLRLVDLRPAAATGALAPYGGTPGYRPPEQEPGGPPGGRLRLRPARPGDPPAGFCRAAPAADLFALGGLFFLLATGHDPLLADHPTGQRPVADRLTRWLQLAARSGATARRLTPLVLGLRRTDPAERWPLPRVRSALYAAGAPLPALREEAVSG